MKRSATKQVVIPSLRQETFEMHVVGSSGLLVHQFGTDARQAIEDKQTGAATGGREFRDPEKEWKDAIYVFPGHEVGKKNCRYGFPAIAFKKAAVNACRYVEGLTMTKARGAFFVKADADAKGPGLVEIIGTPVRHDSMVRTATGVSMPRYRGVFEEWSSTFEVSFNPTILSADQLVNLFQSAGFHVGIGEMRPEQNGGEYGQFVVSMPAERNGRHTNRIKKALAAG